MDDRNVKRRQILLIIGGGIAAYKCLDLVRRLGERGIGVRVVMTEAAQQFITPLSVSALTNDRVFRDLFDLDDEREIGHIRLSRQADLIVVAPATANLIAKMAGGLANDLATAVLLATDKRVLVAPAMNPKMWQHPATRRNVAQLRADGLSVLEPGIGEMAERNEAGPGRLPEVPELVAAIEGMLEGRADADEQIAISSELSDRHVLITSGPTHEPIDPVRYIANRSSGKQGHALAAAAAEAGARVTLVTGPVSLNDPAGVTTIHVETAEDMLIAVKRALPADIAIFAAAVADWRVVNAKTQKIKKKGSKTGPVLLELCENPDILKTIAKHRKKRPSLVIGFAAETHDVLRFAKKKRKSKGADWIAANDVSPETGIMGGDQNQVTLITRDGRERWPKMSKAEVAKRLIARAALELDRQDSTHADAAQ